MLNRGGSLAPAPPALYICSHTHTLVHLCTHATSTLDYDSDNDDEGTYRAIFSSSRSRGSTCKLRSYMPATLPAFCIFDTIYSCNSLTGVSGYGTFWYCWMSRMTSAVFAHLEKLMRSVSLISEGMPSSMKVRSVR